MKEVSDRERRKHLLAVAQAAGTRRPTVSEVKCCHRPGDLPAESNGHARELEKGLLDHISVGFIDLERSRRFYDAALRPVGLVRAVDFQGRGSDYGAMAGQFGVEFTITVEPACCPCRECISASALRILRPSVNFPDD